MDSLAACYSSDGEPSSSAAFSGFPLEISDNFDIDEMQLLELYKRIPPPHLRSYALSHTTNKVVVEIAQRVKDDGHFDTFRKTWMKDLETKVQHRSHYSFNSPCRFKTVLKERLSSSFSLSIKTWFVEWRCNAMIILKA